VNQKNKTIETLRTEIDQADRAVIEALAKRENLVAQIAESKHESAPQIRDELRETAVLQHLTELAGDLGLDTYFVGKLYRDIMNHSVRIQEERFRDRVPPEQAGALRIGYQGTEGAYSSLAAKQHFGSLGKALQLRGYETFADMMAAVRDGALDYGMLPVENTTAGSINEAYDLLAQMDVKVVGEEIFKVEHCLVALEEVHVSQIRRVLSHPQALLQCSRFLSGLENCQVESYVDTAMAVQKVREERNLSQAAVASEEAARHFGLYVIQRDIANQRDNYTRFVVVAKQVEAVDARVACKTSIIFAVRDEKGALLSALNVLAAHGLNLTKLESRPRPNVPWHYLFYVDFQGNLANDGVAQALRELAGLTEYLKVLGAYPERTGGGNQVGAEIAPSPLIPLPRGEREISAETIKLLEKKAYRLASRATRVEDTLIQVQHVVIGGDRPVIMAGPCSVESREQVMAVAKKVKECGADILRGGVFKPRTSPYDFQGLGYEGLDLLYEAGRQYGMPIITEVMHPNDVKRVAEKADIIQIGARNMQNFSLLKELGTIDRPVMLKRGLMSTIDEWLNAAEYILAHGNQRVILCERGIRTFETATRSTLDLSAVPVLKERTHLPVIVDPSHAAGTWQYISPLAEAALAVGAHGIIVEVHPEPKKALSDGPQALKFDTFAALMSRLRR